MSSIQTGDPDALGFSAARLARVQRWLEAQVTSERVAGASVLVARHGEPVFAQATGKADVAHDKPFELDTIVRLYSMTKAVTTVAIMQLYEQGKLGLDDPIFYYIPALQSQFAGEENEAFAILRMTETFRREAKHIIQEREKKNGKTILDVREKIPVREKKTFRSTEELQ